jgi:hypothetical protein
LAKIGAILMGKCLLKLQVCTATFAALHTLPNMLGWAACCNRRVGNDARFGGPLVSRMYDSHATCPYL